MLELERGAGHGVRTRHQPVPSVPSSSSSSSGSFPCRDRVTWTALSNPSLRAGGVLEPMGAGGTSLHASLETLRWAVAFPGQVLLVSLLVVTEAVEQSVCPAELCTGLFRLYTGQGAACPADELGPIPMNAAVSWLNPGPSSAAARCRGRWGSVEPLPLSSVLWLFHPCEQGRAARDARHGSASSLLGKRWFGLTRREMKWKLCRAARLPPRVSSAGSACSGEPPAPRPPGAALAFHQLFLLI